MGIAIVVKRGGERKSYVFPAAAYAAASYTHVGPATVHGALGVPSLHRGQLG